jgi:hypothetical protein
MCSRSVCLEAFTAPGYGTFQIEVSSLGYWTRCDMKLDGTPRLPPVQNCVGHSPGWMARVDGSLQCLLVPCTVFRPRVRFMRNDDILYDDFVTTE